MFPVFSFTYFRYFVRFHYHHINLNIANVNSIVPEEGWFGQPKYSTKLILLFYVVSVSAFQFKGKRGSQGYTGVFKGKQGYTRVNRGM